MCLLYYSVGSSNPTAGLIWEYLDSSLEVANEFWPIHIFWNNLSMLRCSEISSKETEVLLYITLLSKQPTVDHS